MQRVQIIIIDYDFNDNLRIMRLFHMISLYFSIFVHSIVIVKNTVIIFIYFYAYENTHTHTHTHTQISSSSLTI